MAILWGVVGAGRVGSRAPRGVVVVTHLRTLVSGIGWRQWGWENSEWMWKMELAKPGEQLSLGVRAKGCGSAWPLGGALGHLPPERALAVERPGPREG